MNKRLLFILCSILLIGMLFSGCINAEKDTPVEHIDRIMEACSDPENEFPSDLLSVEFLEYETPNAEHNYFQYTFRFENISDGPLETEIHVFYDIAPEEHILSHTNGLPGNTSTSPVTLEPNDGWVFDIPVSPAETWSSYSDEAQNKMIDLAKHLYFEITLNDEVYYCLLDFQAQKLITVL